MKRTLLVLALFVGISLAATDLSNLSGQGCSYIDNEWKCQKPMIIRDASAFFKDDVGCFSSDGQYADLGCITVIELTEGTTVQDCKYKVVDDEIVYEPCEDVSLAKGDALMAMINPDEIDYSGCSEYQNESLYITECPYVGKKMTFSGVLDLGSDDDNIVLVTDVEMSREAGIGQLLLDNLLYIVLIAVIIIIAYWVFMPHKPMFKERLPKMKEQLKKEEPIATRREKRYGRRL